MSLRVGLDMQAARMEPTGIGAYAISLADALRRQENVEVVPLDWGRDPVMRLHRRLQWQQWGLPLRARRRVDLLHVTGFDAPIWQPVPVVLTVHDLIGVLFPENLPPIARFYWSRWLPWSVRLACHIIADSACTKRDLRHLLRVPERRITVVPLAADRRFVPQAEATIAAVRARLGLPERFVLFVGTLEPRKGIDTLVTAWTMIAASLPDVALVIAGKPGWYAEQVYTQVRQAGLEGRIHFTGYVSDVDLPALYGAAEVFAFPSFYEGFGLPPLEAMACGIPVVSSNAASLLEVVGDAGLLVAPEDAPALAKMLRLVLTQPALQAELRARGLRRASAFSWERTARATREVYERVAHST